MFEHKAKLNPKSFSVRYSVNMLVWYSEGSGMIAAIEFEKKIKNRGRAWKIALGYLY